MHDTTKCTPSTVMLSLEIRLLIDLALGLLEKRQNKSQTDYVHELEKHLVVCNTNIVLNLTLFVCLVLNDASTLVGH